MNKLKFCAASVTVTALAGCAATPNYDKHFGDAVRQARAAMTINPKASANGDPVAGMDGQAARQAVARYQDSFKAPPAPVPVVSLSSSSSSAAGAPTGGGETK